MNFILYYFYSFFVSSFFSFHFFKNYFAFLRGLVFVTESVSAPEDLSITKIAGLTWDQWNARLAMPLVTTLREGAHPLVFPRDLCVSPMDVKPRIGGRSPNESSSGNGNNNGGNGTGCVDAFTCPDCGRMYKLKSSLRNHQKWECGKEPQFQCPYCVYRAKQKMHIGRHMERMHKEKFFKVDPDGKVIALDEALNQIVQATGCAFNSTM